MATEYLRLPGDMIEDLTQVLLKEGCQEPITIRDILDYVFSLLHKHIEAETGIFLGRAFYYEDEEALHWLTIPKDIRDALEKEKREVWQGLLLSFPPQVGSNTGEKEEE